MPVKYFDSLPKEAINIRTAVFVDEQGFCNEFDKTDSKALHIVMYSDDNTPAAVCRIFRENENDAFILGRIAVIKEFRGKGMGKAIIREAEKAVMMKDGKIIKLHAQLRLKDFYAGLGYKDYGMADEDEGCPHIWMVKEIGK